MALIKCPECGNQISDQAKSCPQCGFVLNKNGSNDKVINRKVMTIAIIAVTTVILLTVAVITIVKLSNPFSGWGTGRKGKEIENQTGPGSIDEPYKMSDVINLDTYDATGYNIGTGERYVENETKFIVSNMSFEDGTYKENFYSFYFDIECVDSEKNDAVVLSDYISLRAVTTDGQDIGAYYIDPENSNAVASLVKGGKMRGGIDISKDDGDIAKIYFQNYDKNGETYRSYIDVNK